ncbi:hypothetical protein B0H14DRAFT_2585278 [Mycena olivaceomarginata]|nr:hypothetical protein B0H14DRAFT_2585278 [Mycena olivaceomarginata]
MCRSIKALIGQNRKYTPRRPENVEILKNLPRFLKKAQDPLRSLKNRLPDVEIREDLYVSSRSRSISTAHKNLFVEPFSKSHLSQFLAHVYTMWSNTGWTELAKATHMLAKHNLVLSGFLFLFFSMRASWFASHYDPARRENVPRNTPNSSQELCEGCQHPWLSHQAFPMDFNNRNYPRRRGACQTTHCGGFISESRTEGADRKFLFSEFFEPRQRIVRISLSSAPIDLKPG